MTNQHGPWTILGSTEKYRNPWITVREDRVLQPGGEPGIFGVVGMVAGVSVLPMSSDGTVLLTKEFKYGIGASSIEAISGGIDQDEEPLDAAMREAREEAGVLAADWTDLGRIDPFTSVVVSPQRLFLARDIRYATADPEPTEQISLIRLSIQEALGMVDRNEIIHAPTCVLLFKVARLLEADAI